MRILDIAGTGWTKRKSGYYSAGATGVGVRLLTELAAGLEQNSDHFIGREILRQAQKRNIKPATIDEIQTGENGVIGRFDGDIVKIGSADFLKDTTVKFNKLSESTTTRTAGGLDFTAKGGKRQGREVPQSLRVKPGAKHPI